MKSIENLPDDCLQSIFNHLNEGDLRSVSLVCKDFLTNLNLSKQNLKVIHPTVSVLSTQLKRFRGIKKIDLSNFLGDEDEAILEIARSGLALEALHILCRKGSPKSLKELSYSSKMKNLKVLNLSLIDCLQDNDLVVIANSFPKLEELKFGYRCPQYSMDNEVEFWASKLKLLKKIHLSGKHIVSDQSLIALSLSCVFLKDVTIWCHSVTENSIGLLLRNRPNLEAISIGYVKMNPSESVVTIENSISHAKALTSLEFFHMHVSDILLNAIAKAKLSLKKFMLSFCHIFESAGLRMILANYQLIELQISVYGHRIVDQDMNLLLNGNVSKLTRIEIDPCKMTKSALSLLSAKCPSLEEIVIGYKTNPLELDKLGFFFPNLRVLDLDLWYHIITTKTIKAILKGCKFLRKLTLKGYKEIKVTEADNSEVSEVNLEDLTLLGSSISDGGLTEITKICPRLVSLDLGYPNKLPVESVKQIVKNITTLNCLGIRCFDSIIVSDLLDWMLATGNLASLKKIYVETDFTCDWEQIAKFLDHGCLILCW